MLEILEGSPAQSAGLVPFGDWIVGYAGGILRGEGDFYEVVEAVSLSFPPFIALCSEWPAYSVASVVTAH